MNLENLPAVETALNQAALLDDPSTTALEYEHALAIVAASAGEVRRVVGELELAGLDSLAFVLHVHGRRSLDDVATALGYAQGKGTRSTTPIKKRLAREHDRRAEHLARTLLDVPAEQITPPSSATDATTSAMAELHTELAAARADSGNTERVRVALDALLATAGAVGTRPAGQLLVHLNRLVRAHHMHTTTHPDQHHGGAT